MIAKLALALALMAAASLAAPQEGSHFIYNSLKAQDDESFFNNARITIHKLDPSKLPTPDKEVQFDGTVQRQWFETPVAEGQADETGEFYITVNEPGAFIAEVHTTSGAMIPVIVRAAPRNGRDRRSIMRRSSQQLSAPSGLACKQWQVHFSYDVGIACILTPMVYTPYNNQPNTNARLASRWNTFFCPLENQDPCPGTNERYVWYWDYDTNAAMCHSSNTFGYATVQISENLSGSIYRAGYFEKSPQWTNYWNQGYQDLITGVYNRGSNGNVNLFVSVVISTLTTVDNSSGQFYSPLRFNIQSDCDANNYASGTYTVHDRVKCDPSQITTNTDTLSFEDSNFPRC